MGFKNPVEIVADLPIEKCFAILREIGSRVNKYKLIGSSDQTFRLLWSKGQGWTAPISVRADLKRVSSTQTKVCFSAEIAALADPFNFSKKAIALFEMPFRESIGNLSSVRKNGTNIESAAATHIPLVADEIHKLAYLKAAGALSEEEFSKQKAKLLGEDRSILH